MALPEPLEMRKDDWELKGKVLRPTHAYTQRYAAWLGNLPADDFIVRFNFAQRTNAPQVSVHQSRLMLIGGPLSVLAQTGTFAEGNNREVNLSEEDNATTFDMIRKFLYAMEVDFTTVNASTLLQLVRSAHRWDIPSLWRSACDFLRKKRMLRTPAQVLEAKDVWSLPGLPSLFQVYFWNCVARFYLYFSACDAASEAQVDIGETIHEVAVELNTKKRRRNACHEEAAGTQSLLSSLCPKFPDLWKIALEQNSAPLAIDAIMRHHEGGDDEALIVERLVDCVLHYLEPRIESDDAVLELLERIRIKPTVAPELVDRAGSQEHCSKRGMLLLSKAILSRSSFDHEQTFSAAVSPALLLDNDVHFTRTGIMIFPGFRGAGLDDVLGFGEECASLGFIIDKDIDRMTSNLPSSGQNISIEAVCRFDEDSMVPECDMHYRLEVQEGLCRCKDYLKVGGKTIMSVTSRENVSIGKKFYLHIPSNRIKEYKSSHGPRCEMRIVLVVNLSYEERSSGI